MPFPAKLLHVLSAFWRGCKDEAAKTDPTLVEFFHCIRPLEDAKWRNLGSFQVEVEVQRSLEETECPSEKNKHS